MKLRMLSLFPGFGYLILLPLLAAPRTAGQSSPAFQLPKTMYASHEGDAITEIGLSAGEISDLLVTVLSTGIDDESMRSAAALKKDLLARPIDLGEGGGKGLVLQGGDQMCGNGSCPTWLFRKMGTKWMLLGPKNYPLDASMLGFLQTKHYGLYDLVTVTHGRYGAVPIEVWQFNGAVYESKDSYCKGEDTITHGDCSNDESPR